MAGTCVLEDTIQCSSCPNRFMQPSEDTGRPRDICEFCSRKQLLEQLRRANAECQQTVVCSNKRCNMVIPRSHLNKHRLVCMFSLFTCPHAPCDFKGTRSEINAHTGICGYRKAPCPDCGHRLAMKDYNDHILQCGTLVQCDKCNLTVPNSAKKTHDDWYCPRRNIRSFCRDCKKGFSYVDFEVHKGICNCKAELETEADAERTFPEHHSILPLDEDFILPDYDEQSQIKMLPTYNSTVSATPISTEMLIDALSAPGNSIDPIMRASAGIQRNPVPITPATRRRWNSLMHEIEENMDTYRMIYQTEQEIPRISRTLSI